MQFGAIEGMDGPQAFETQRTSEPVDIVAAQAQLFGETFDRTLRGPRVDLQSHDRKEPPTSELLLESEEEIIGGVIVES